MTTDGVFRILCSDAEDSQHPEEIILTQNVPVADFEPFDNLQLGLSYNPDGSGTSSRGTVRAFVRQLGADGTRPLLDVFSARQDTATSEVAAVTTVAPSLEEGDALLWKVRFRQFEPLDERQCVVLITFVTPTLDEPEPVREEER